jgi:hypothetical protein
MNFIFLVRNENLKKRKTYDDNIAKRFRQMFLNFYFKFFINSGTFNIEHLDI